MGTRVIRQHGALRVERSALGQVAEYDVYDGDSYQGGGSKREALRIYDRLVKGAS